MGILDALATSPALLITAMVLLGLLTGSFLNVVILRLPRMLENAWREEASAILEVEAPKDQPALSLARPASHCTHCGAPIPAWRNIPVVSWLLLRGRAACCGAPISVQYPLVELLAGVVAGLCAWRFGWSWELLAAYVLAMTLIAAAVIDWNTQLLPDNITLPLLWLGLLLNTMETFVPLQAAVLGAAAGYLSLWSVFMLFKLVTGKEGMGFGDFKLLAALGAWFGWTALPMLLLLSSLVGAVIGITFRVSGRLEAGAPMPYGPFIAGAGLLWLLAPMPMALF
ncbi:prepilin peptidase [Algiphilus sp.]|uniref:prepilin peptidase n=1 Tax=Algiphilus sp. TaxID=1872431 RepID=UPI003B51E70A